MRTRNVAIRRTKPEPRPAGVAMPLRYSLLIAMCGSILVAGFFFAARQHFSSIDYGIKNSRLRRQIDELEAEKRRLLLAKEVSLSPAQIRKTALKLGLTTNTENGNPAAAVAIPVKVNDLATIARTDSASHIKTIVISKPVKAVAPEIGPKVQKAEPQAKREIVVRDKKG
jgi:hypothetical protein